jgi:tetratricopeptide (TPR) repeat protein
MFDYQLYGLNAGGYHLTNLILHILSTLLLFWLFCRMTKEIWKSAFVAALFALHPLHVESVAWISERKDVLSAFFWMLTLCLYVYYTEKPAIKRYLLVVFAFVLALMSKPMVITLPVIMILLDYWPLKRFESQKSNLFFWQLKEKISFIILSAVLVIISLQNPIKPAIKLFPLISRLANAPVAFVTYLIKTFWPHDMAVFYPFPSQIPVWQAMGATFLIIVISAFVILKARRLPYLFVGWFWFAITIAPVIGIIQISIHAYAMADRYHYLPSIGIVMMLAWGIPSLIKNKNIHKKILLPTALVFLIIMSALTWKQCAYWKNDATLLNHALRVTKNNYLAHTNLGASFFEKGKIKDALYHFNKAILIKPDYFYIYVNRGNTFYNLGQYQRVIEDYTKALSLRKDYAEGYYTRGNVYYILGNYQKSFADYSNAIHLNPDYAEAYNNRGTIYYNKLNQYQKSIEDYNNAIILKPDFADAYNNRAFVYLNNGDSVAGCRDARKACDLRQCVALINAQAKGLCR